MTLILAIGAGVIMTAIAVAIGGFLLDMLLSAINRSLHNSIENVARPQAEISVIDLHPAENTLGAMEWGKGIAA